MRNLALVVSRAYKECKLRSILLKCTRARAVHGARLGTFCHPLECSGLTPCIVANQHLSRLQDTSAQGYVPDPPSLFSRTGGAGDETMSTLCQLTMASFSSVFLLSRDRLRGGVVTVASFFGETAFQGPDRVFWSLGHFNTFQSDAPTI